MTSLGDTLCSLDDEYPISSSYDAYQDYFLSVLNIIAPSEVPEVASSSLRILEHFRRGEADGGELSAACIDCWNYLDRNDHWNNETRLDIAFTRALICALSEAPEAGQEGGELVGTFLQILEPILSDSGKHRSLSLLQNYFPGITVGNDGA